MTEGRTARYTIFVTYDYVEKYEVDAADEDDARRRYELGQAEHVETHPPQRRRLSIRKPGQIAGRVF
jgi:hypothetical protein